MHSVSPYLRQHAHNPVNWYPWGREAIDRAKAENKPILLSVGYSTCYWCHVMEREVFMNPSIATQMNEHFINIKVDREEYPALDEMYMVARQLMTREGGWPNNVFLTPDLKPFYAGGTFPPSDQPGRTSFPRLLEWLHYSWTTQSKEILEAANGMGDAVKGFLHHMPATGAKSEALPVMADRLFLSLKKHFDESAGGFFQAPKFPHENYLSYLAAYHEHTGDTQALDMLRLSLRKMAAGGIYDHVGCGFHRYAVDKEWYVPHFEKMLYTQAMLARIYTDAARLDGNAWFADIAKSILEFVLGPMTDGNGAFYAAIDAETDGVEGAYYAWSPKEFEQILTQEETQFLVSFYALADIPKFPGHKHVDGQALIARQALDEAAKQRGLSYLQLSAMCGQVMNKLLTVRNMRQAPNLDNKIIVAWNGLMIDAFAHAGKVFEHTAYVEAARRAADYLLEHAIDTDGKLCRIISGGKAQIEATLEDYACFIKGLLTLHDASPDEALLEAVQMLFAQANELFLDKEKGGYFFTGASDDLLVRIKNADDATLPNANAIMLENMLTLHRLTGEEDYRKQAIALRDYFLNGSDKMLVELAGLVRASLALEEKGEKAKAKSAVYVQEESPEAEAQGQVKVSANIFPADPRPGENCEIIVALDIAPGWHIHASKVHHPLLVPTQVDVQAPNAQLVEVVYPQASKKAGEDKLVYEGLINVTARMKIFSKAPGKPPFKVRVRYQPCTDTVCHAVRDISTTI